MAAPATLSIAAPEQVDVRLPLAGQGSRCLAFALDALLRYGAAALLLILAHWTADLSQLPELHGLAFAAVTLGFFAAQWVYLIAFETLGEGQTPGKRWLGLRVLELDGTTPGFTAVALRNVLRVVDLLPVFYLLGQSVLFATPKRQRIGDLVARTVVVEDRPRKASDALALQSDERRELAAEFLRRRHELTSHRRRELAQHILVALERGEVEASVDAEARLESLAVEASALESSLR